MRAFVTCDGEAKQIEVFQETEMIDLINATLVDLGKTPASCSAVYQSSDVSPLFKAAKKRLASLNASVPYRDQFITRKAERDS